MSRSLKRVQSLAQQFVKSSIPVAKQALSTPSNVRTSASMSNDYKFQGWLGLDKDSANGKMVWKEFAPKPFEETDVDIKITHCGICGSDIHTLRSGWGETNYPVCKFC